MFNFFCGLPGIVLFADLGMHAHCLLFLILLCLPGIVLFADLGIDCLLFLSMLFVVEGFC